MKESDFFDKLRCPCSKKAYLIRQSDFFKCINNECIHSKKEFYFPILNGIPLLVSEHKCDTVCDVKKYQDANFYYVERKLSKYNDEIRKFLYGSNSNTVVNCKKFIDLLNKSSLTPQKKSILIIGSASKGLDTEQLWSGQFTLIGLDIHPSDTTSVIADAHYLPFADSVFDGVWIQAVLEHVANPQLVVYEIERVLRKSGVVYAETPFMQQVHEGAYDFQRFTNVGHRYLFKNFTAISMGGNQGPGIALAWSIKYFIWGLTRSRYFAIALSLPFYYLLKILDRFCDPRIMYDGASGVYFLGIKLGFEITQKEALLAYYGFQQNKKELNRD